MHKFRKAALWFFPVKDIKSKDAERRGSKD